MKTAHEIGLDAALSTRIDRFGIPYAEAVEREDVETLLRAYLGASGLVLVPFEPTNDMLRMADKVILSDDEIEAGPYEVTKAEYKEMLRSAPNPFESKP